MKQSRKALVFAVLSLMATTMASAQTQKLRFGFGFKSISPIIVDILIPEYLGYYREEGLSVEPVALGSDSAMFAALNSKRIEFSIGTAAFQLPLVAKGEKLPAINFFESTYPFKFGMATRPDKSIKSFTEFKGKRIGVIGFGNTNYVVAHKLIKIAGLDPDKEVSWLAVGLGTMAGVALQKGDVDALFYDDTGFAQIEASGIPLAYVPLPSNVPKVSGLYLSAPQYVLTEHRAWAVGFARGVAKAHVFIQENPKAAAAIFAQMYPEALPKGKSAEEQIAAIALPIARRMPLYSPYDKAVTKWGFIKETEWQDEIDLHGYRGKVNDTSALFTNDLIDDINTFDAEAIKAQGRAFAMPDKKR